MNYLSNRPSNVIANTTTSVLLGYSGRAVINDKSVPDHLGKPRVTLKFKISFLDLSPFSFFIN